MPRSSKKSHQAKYTPAIEDDRTYALYHSFRAVAVAAEEAADSVRRKDYKSATVNGCLVIESIARSMRSLVDTIELAKK